MNTPVVDSYVDDLLNDGALAFDMPMEADTSPATAATVPVPVGVPDAIPALAPAPAPSPAAPPRAEQSAAPSELPKTLRAHHAPTMASSEADASTDAGGTGDPRQTSPVTNSSRWLRVGVGNDHYAFELLRVQEVVRVAPVVAVRGAAPAVLGVMNLRGRIVPVFDLGQWLNTPPVITDEHSRIVVVERDDELIGVLVTCVEDVATLQPSTIEPPMAGTRKGTIIGVARVARTPTVLLDANALFD